MVGFADLVLLVSLVQPVVEVEADVFAGRPATEVQLVGTSQALGLGFPEVNPAVVLAVLVDLVLQPQVEVLVVTFAYQYATALWVTVLTAHDDAVLHPPLGLARRFPLAEVLAVKDLNVVALGPAAESRS